MHSICHHSMLLQIKICERGQITRFIEFGHMWAAWVLRHLPPFKALHVPAIIEQDSNVFFPDTATTIYMQVAHIICTKVPFFKYYQKFKIQTKSVFNYISSNRLYAKLCKSWFNMQTNF